MTSNAPFVLLDDARPGRERLRFFSRPHGVITAHHVGDVAPALAALADAQARGLHAVGYFSYELGYALEPRLIPLMPHRRTVPLLWFALFGEPREMDGEEGARWFAQTVTGRAYAGPLRLTQSRQSYAEKFRRVADYIAAGDVYQVNLTFPAHFAFAGDPCALYRKLRLRAGAGHGAYIFDGTRYILSFSPELFFSSDGGALTARPMKGTAARGQDEGEDARRRVQLSLSDKDRAENLMIVDLIRNDLGRIAKIGSVRVEELFAIETYPTVHQMVSTVRAELRPGISPADLIGAIFPCGSVTGTPKIRAQEIIRELEPAPRGIYCGAIGCFSPDGSAQFNVAIRTLTIQGATGTLGVGGGVVADSRSNDEYDECLLKARYYTEKRPPLSLIETLRHEPGQGFVRGELHLARMARSAQAFGISFDRSGALQHLNDAVKDVTGPSRARLLLDETGAFTATAQSIAPAAPVAPGTVWTYAISERRVLSGDSLARHKTDWRALYDQERAAWNERGCDEVVYLNERGEVVEGSTTNIFVRSSGRLLTPPLNSGALDGCLRRALFESGECTETTLTLSDLDTASVVYLGNSLRGLIEAVPFAHRAN